MTVSDRGHAHGISPAGDRISLEAVPSSDYRFNEWTKRSGENFSGSGATITISQFDDDTTLAVSFTNYKVCDGDDIHEVIVTPGTSLVYRDGGEVEVTVRFSSDCDVISTRYRVYEDKTLAINPVASGDVSPSSGLIARDNHTFELTVSSRTCWPFSVDNNFYIQFSGSDTHYGQFKRTCDQEMVTLTLEVGTGGHVDGIEGNSDCIGPRTCRWDIPKGNRISLRAVPGEDYRFNEWTERSGERTSGSGATITISSFDDATTLAVSFTNYRVCDGNDITSVTRSTSSVGQNGGTVRVTVNFDDGTHMDTTYTVYRDRRFLINPEASDHISPSRDTIRAVGNSRSFNLSVARCGSSDNGDDNFYIQFSGDDRETHYGQFTRTCQQMVTLTLRVGTGGYVDGIEDNSDCRGSRTCTWDIPKGKRITLRAIANSGYTWDEWRRNSGERYAPSSGAATITISSFDDPTSLEVSFTRVPTVRRCDGDDISRVTPSSLSPVGRSGGTISVQVYFDSGCDSIRTSYTVYQDKTLAIDPIASSDVSPSGGTIRSNGQTINLRVTSCGTFDRVDDNFYILFSGSNTKRARFKRDC